VSKCWPDVRLGEIVRQEREQVGTPEGNGLQVLGVTNVSGVTHTGVQTSDDRSKYLRLRPGRFAYNPYRVNVGSIGLSAETQDGICSPAYVVFAPTERVRARFLWFFLKSARGSQLINFCGNRGTVRGALRFEDLCEIEMPLPPVAEQQRIVARIEGLSALVDEARALRSQASEGREVLVASELHRRFVVEKNMWPRVSVGDAAEIVDPNPSHRMPRYVESGIPFVSTVDFEGTEGIRRRTAKYVAEETYREQFARCRFAPGDILYSRIGTIGEARALEEVWPFALSHVLVVVKPKARVLPRFLLWYLRSDSIVAQAYEATRSVGVPDLGIKKIRGFHMPLPPFREQRRIVAELDALQTEVDAAKRLQAETGAELDALLPSILDRAFKGEL